MDVQVHFLDGSFETLGKCASGLEVKRCVALLKGLPRHDHIQVLTVDGCLLDDEGIPPADVTALLQGSSITLGVHRFGVEVTRVVVEDLMMRVADLGHIIVDALDLGYGARPILSCGDETMHPSLTLQSYSIQEGAFVNIDSVEGSLTRCAHKGSSLRSKFLGSTASLRTMDQLQSASLLPRAEREGVLTSVVNSICAGVVGDRAADFVGELPNLLTPRECSEVLENARGLNICPLDVGDGVQSNRKYRRLLVQDPRLAETLWLRAEPSIRAALQHCDLRPLGFGCSHGEWELVGLNPGMRINQYAAAGFIGLHRDSQYIRNVDCRSLLTLLVPLQSRGFVRFYQPREVVDCRNMTLAEEIEARGGLHNGYTSFVHTYQAGTAVILGQAVLHEGMHDDRHGPAKALLRTDVLVERVRHPPLLPVLLESERHDHIAALKLFRLAQQADLRGVPSDNLYERALSYRYAHPCLNHELSNEVADEADIRVGEPRQQGVEIAGAVEGLSTTICPRLSRVRNFIMPTLVYQSGPVAAFVLSAAQEHNSSNDETLPLHKSATDAHLRVVAMYAFHLLGHPTNKGNLYTARFDSTTYEVTALPLRDLLRDAFLSRSCFGSIYNVWAEDPAMPNPPVDFARSVDRTHMVLAHGCGHIGDDIVSQCGSVIQIHTRHRSEHDGSYAVNDWEPIDTDEDCGPERLGFVACRDAIMHKIETNATPAELYLKGLLDLGRCGLPGRESFVSKSIVASGFSLCSGMYGDCGRYDYEDLSVPPTSRTINNLVFDFERRSMVICDWNERPLCSDATVGLDDPFSLWKELESEIRGAGLDFDSFSRYSVGLEEVLKDSEHSFHHAGGCGCEPSEKYLHLRSSDFDKGDHATRVLIAVGEAREVFGHILQVGDILVWTIYHGFTAL